MVVEALRELGRDVNMETPDEILAEELLELHFLWQDEKEMASFHYHDDYQDLRDSARGESLKAPEELRTVVVQVSSKEQSAMRMLYFQPHVYTGRGAAVAFHGAATHCSMRWSNPRGKLVRKVAFFFSLPAPSYSKPALATSAFAPETRAGVASAGAASSGATSANSSFSLSGRPPSHGPVHIIKKEGYLVEEGLMTKLVDVTVANMRAFYPDLSLEALRQLKARELAHHSGPYHSSETYGGTKQMYHKRIVQELYREPVPELAVLMAGTQVLMAMQGDEMVGFISFELQDVPTMHGYKQVFILEAQVSKHMQGFGIGTRLFNHLEAMAMASLHRIPWIELSVHTRNADALNFYKKMGMVEV